MKIKHNINILNLQQNYKCMHKIYIFNYSKLHEKSFSVPSMKKERNNPSSVFVF